MPNLKDIRNRIDSVKNTQKITKAMKMVAAAKLNRAQERVKAARPYAVKMREVIANLAERVEADAHPLLQERELPASARIYVISSNRGLCGGFNSNLFRAVDTFITDEQFAGESVDVVTIGRKAAGYVRRSNHALADNLQGIIDQVEYDTAADVAQHAVRSFLDGEADEVYVAYNEFISAIQYESHVEPILPLSIDNLRALADEDDQADAQATATEYIYEPDEEALLGEMIPRYVEVQFLRALLESDAAEQGARMTAMDNATNNAADMIDSLTTEYNRARQAYITKEICEIVSGAESLKG